MGKSPVVPVQVLFFAPSHIHEDVFTSFLVHRFTGLLLLLIHKLYYEVATFLEPLNLFYFDKKKK